MDKPMHWPTFLRELDAAEQTWKQQPVRYPRLDAVPWMPYPLAQFAALLTEAVMACSRPRDYNHVDPDALMFLDVGCGPGTKCRLAEAMFGLDVYGIDIVPRFIGEAQAHGVRSMVADAFEFGGDGETVPPGATGGNGYARYDIVLVNRPSGLQDELEGLIMEKMSPGAVLMAVNWRHDPGRENDWHAAYQEYGEPVCGVFIKP